MRDSSATSIPATWAPTITGMPIAPYAPAATLATSDSIAALTGRNPSCTSSAAQIAIGTPNPAAPSRNAPNAKVISSTWMRWSVEIPEIEARMTSNRPLATANRYSHTAMTMM